MQANATTLGSRLTNATSQASERPLRRRLPLRRALGSCAVLALARGVLADVTIGGLTFEDEAFATRLISASPDPSTGAFTHESLDPDGPTPVHTVELTLPAQLALLESLLVGSELDDWAGLRVAHNSSVTLGFDAIRPIDGAGDDLVVFDIGNAEAIEVTIAGTSRVYTFVATGQTITAGFGSLSVNAARVDLADFGVTSAGVVTLTAPTGGALDPDPTAVGVLNGSPAAAVALRSAGTNPLSYSANPVVIGSSFTASVDNGLAAQVASVLIGFDTPATLLLAGGQTLLCLDLGSGEMFTGAGLSPSSSLAGVDGYSAAVPDLPALCGLTIHSQAIQFGSPPFVLSNAQDLTIGPF